MGLEFRKASGQNIQRYACSGRILSGRLLSLTTPLQYLALNNHNTPNKLWISPRYFDIKELYL
jgi:hypothetical protein